MEQGAAEKDETNMKRKIIRLILLGLVLFACLLGGGYYGAKMLGRTRLRRAAMTAYEKGEYAEAERLLQDYVQKNPNSEAEFVVLANIYHEFGDLGMEAQMWQSASSLNPREPEYREKMMTSMIKSANYALLRGILGRKAKVDDQFTDRELYLFVISSYRAGYPKDAEDAYRKAVEADPGAFQRNELGQMAEFMANYETLSEGDRDIYLSRAMQSEDPVVRFEAIYIAFRRMEQREGDDSQNDNELERLLKQAVEINYFVGTAFLADFYFSRNRFAEVADVLEPYLKTIDDISLYLLYAESCVFMDKKDALKVLGEKLRGKPDSLQFLADYCEILIAYLENDEEKLAVAVRKTGRRIDSQLSRFIHLRVAMANESFNEILTVAQVFFTNPPFYDLYNRALFICLDYISNEMKKPENRKDPSQIAALARVLSGYLHGNRLLTEIILMDQYKNGLVKEADLMEALEEFPDDALLQRITAEYLILNEKSEQAMPVIEQIQETVKGQKQEPERGVQILFMLALDQLGQHDEAAAVFRELVLQSEFDLELLGQYFLFCLNNKRTEDLITMADELDTSDGDPAHFGKFFRAAALLTAEDGSKVDEALDLLASTPNDAPEFAFYAANCLLKYDRFDDAETKYNAILATYRTPSLIYVNLSSVYHAKGEEQKAMKAAEKAFDLEKESMLPAYVYAERLFESERYEDAVEVLNFPRYAVNYRADIIELWCACMKKVIEKSIRDRKFLQAEEQCKHLLIVSPDDEFGQEHLEKMREILFPKNE